MSKRCLQCNDKLESFTVMESITSVMGGMLNWHYRDVNFCDNEKCKQVGLLTVACVPKAQSKSNNKDTGDE